MNKFVALLIAIGAAVMIYSQVGGAAHPAVFKSISFSEALESNRTSGQLLIVKATASWCGPCKMMNRDTFVDADVVQQINASGIAIALDVDRENAAAQALGVRSIPTTIIFVNGEEVARQGGYLPPEEFLTLINGAARAAKRAANAAR